MRKKTIIPHYPNSENIPDIFKNLMNGTADEVTELRKRDALRRDLIANVAHDLRAPLSSIRGYLETLLMRDEKLGAEDRQQFLQTILRSAVQLSNMIEQLFELSRLEAGQIQPNPEPFPLRDLVQDVILKFKPFAAQNNITISIELVAEIAPVFADIGMIERVITNLLDNALRFTPPGGSIKISLTCTEEGVRFCMSDTGCGIAPDDLPFVFDRYYRKKRMASEENKGAGLGLAITKRILELQNSRIQVESRLGVGTKFYFDLPVYENRQKDVKLNLTMENC